MISTVTKDDPQYAELKRGRNARFPLTDADSVARIEVCETADDVVAALGRAVAAGKRPTVRSGGHCYEDFAVNNPGGVLLDVRGLKTVSAAPGGGYQVGAGAYLGEVYTALFEQAQANLPLGSCYTVGAGGHISGGGYGLLTRQQGLSIDLLTGVDIATVQHNGKVILRHADRHKDPDLFRALRGGGGANFGVVTNFYFDKLPAAPKQLTSGGISLPWDTMTEEKFIQMAQTYGHYFATRGQEPDTWPMFTMMGLTHKTPNGRMNVSATWHDMDGKNDLSVISDFLDLFLKCGEAAELKDPQTSAHAPSGGRFQQAPCVEGKHRFNTKPWLEATIDGNSGGIKGYGSTRGKYKSCYMKQNFTVEELKRMYAWLTRDIPNVNTGCVIAVDSYGGAANRPHLAHETAVPQRASILKLQYQMYWQDPAEDAARLKYFDDLYTDVYSANVPGKHAGTPFHGEYYEGCYINYPDVDMTRYKYWPELYYGTGGLYPFLQAVKKKYDPNNIFHNSMAVRA
ncbi:MAG: FAD-dependent oxidoreductase [Janthinobacterium lividum]